MNQLNQIIIAFRADASLQIGIGHVMRCLTLADAIKELENVICHFICREHSGNLLELIQQRGHVAHVLPAPNIDYVDESHDQTTRSSYTNWLGASEETDARETAAILELLHPAWLIVDHYAIGILWEKTQRPHTSKLMVIDDLNDRPHDCDLLLDQNLGRSTSDYIDLVPVDCIILTGLKYALLRPEFAALRSYSLDRRCKSSEVKHLLISMGGVDKNNATGMVLDSLINCPLPADCRITVVVGSRAPWLTQVREQCTQMPWATEVLVDVQNVARLMADSDLAIGAAGSTAWERCVLGLPTLMWPVAENQRATADALAEHGAAYVPNVDSFGHPERLSTHIVALFASTKLREHIGTCAASVCDGNGTNRVANFFTESNIRLRPSTMEDCDDLHRWRNHPATRLMSSNTREIPYLEHRAWFEQSIVSPSRVLLIAELYNEPVGVLRYDLTNDIAEVSFYRVPDTSCRNIGTTMLRAGDSWLTMNHPEIRLIRAVVLGANIASKKVLANNCGFLCHHVVYEKTLMK